MEKFQPAFLQAVLSDITPHHYICSKALYSIMIGDWKNDNSIFNVNRNVTRLHSMN